jgi:hypothetical protein
VTDPAAPTPPVRGVEYKGEPLDSDRGPGLGCFRFQLIVLAVAIVLTPLSVAWGWPIWASTLLLVLVIVLLLFAGQTIIFLLRLVAADRRAAGRRRPLAARTRTVGEIEDVTATRAAGADADPDADRSAASGGHDGTASDPAAPSRPDDEGGVPQ